MLIPQVEVAEQRDPNNTRMLKNTKKMPTVRNLTAALHKTPAATGGFTSCVRTITSGTVKMVYVCLTGMRPVVHELWREKYLEIGLQTEENWVSKDSRSVIRPMKDLNIQIYTADNQREQVIATYGYEAIYTDIQFPIKNMLVINFYN